MAHMESLWPGLAELPLVVESCEYDRLHAVLAHEFQRVTTHVRPVGAGADGRGEDVSVHVEDGSSLHETQPALPLAGGHQSSGHRVRGAGLAHEVEEPGQHARHENGCRQHGDPGAAL